MPDKQIPVPLSVMTGQGNFFSFTVRKREKNEQGKVVWKEEVKTYDIAGIPLEKVDEYFADSVSIGAQIFNLRDEEAKRIQNKWLPLVVSKNGIGLELDDLFKDGLDTKNLRELWRTVLDLSGF
ncbi:MAG: hypothetical protein A4E52_02044 [Pelotomaculum sp. PtaB.Bin013]|nr:MAG: hypothetical protein A4E52_02044 [Pelotomaculum sp. PtaB.Bin013]